MFRGHRRRAVGPRAARGRGSAAAWVSVRRRRRWRSVAPLLLRPRAIVEPISSVETEFFRRRAFYVRVGGLGLIAMTLFAVLLLRLWSLQVIQGTRFEHAARA